MGRAKEVLKRELLDLDPADRAEIAEDALRSLEGTDYGELSPAWEAEIQNRLRDAENGSAELIPGDDVFREIEAELRARRGLDVFRLQVRVRGEDVIGGLAGREQTENRADGHPHASDTGTSAHDGRRA